MANGTEWNPLKIPFPEVQGNYCDSNISQCESIADCSSQQYVSALRPTTPRELTEEEVERIMWEGMWFNRINNPTYIGLMCAFAFLILVVVIVYYLIYRKQKKLMKK